MNIQVIPSQQCDAEKLAQKLREADKVEVMASHGTTPIEALSGSLAASDEAFTVFLDGEPIAMFGVAPLVPGTHEVGTPWLLASPDLERISMRFLRECGDYIARFQQRYPILTNWVDCRNKVSQRWLRWCGFKAHRFEPEHGHGKQPFIQYVRFSKCVTH